jgi:phage-related minor tail protein
VDDAGTMVDQMAKTASSTNTSVAQLGEGILTIGATAKSVKGGTAELNTALGILANNGIKGAEGGTHLRNIILSLQNPTDKAAACMEQLGVDVYDSQGNMRSMNDILGDLNTSMDGMTSAEKSNIISTIFNKTDLSSVNALLANTGDTWDDLQQSITDSGGAAQQMADTQLDNLQGQLTILKSALEGLAISFGELLMPAIKSIVSFIQKFVDKLNSMDEGTKKVIVTVALVVAALGPVLIIVGKVISAVGTIMTVVPKVAGVINTVKGAFAALNTTMLANPIFLIIAAITALVAAFIYLWNTNEDFRQFWIDLWNNIKEVAVAVWNAIKEFFTSVWNGIKSVAETVWGAISSFFSTLWEGIKTIFSTVLEVIKTVVTTYFNVYKTIITTVFNAIKTIVTTVWNGIKTVITTVVGAIQTFLATAWNTIKTVISTVLNAIKTVFATIWNAIKTVITTVVNAIQTVITTVWNAIKTVVTTVMNAIKTVITTVWNTVKTTVSTVLNGIKTAVSTVFTNILSAIKTAMSKVLGAVKDGFSKVKEHITGLASQAVTWGKDLIMGIVDGIKSCISKVGDAAKDVADKIKSFLHFSVPDEGPLTDYESWMPDFMEGLAKGIEKSKGLVADAVEGVAGDMVINPNVSATTTAMESTKTSAENTLSIVSAIRDGLANMNNQVGDISIPVYIGGNLLDEVVVNAQQRVNLRSGGR